MLPRGFGRIVGQGHLLVQQCGVALVAFAHFGHIVARLLAVECVGIAVGLQQIVVGALPHAVAGSIALQTAVVQHEVAWRACGKCRIVDGLQLGGRLRYVAFGQTEVGQQTLDVEYLFWLHALHCGSLAAVEVKPCLWQFVLHQVHFAHVGIAVNQQHFVVEFFRQLSGLGKTLECLVVLLFVIVAIT